MTGAERAIRHGELKQLRKLKREYENETSHKPKILKIDKSMEVEMPDYEKEDTTTDIRDVEFRMKNNPAQVQVNMYFYFTFPNVHRHFLSATGNLAYTLF